MDGDASDSTPTTRTPVPARPRLTPASNPPPPHGTTTVPRFGTCSTQLAGHRRLAGDDIGVVVGRHVAAAFAAPPGRARASRPRCSPRRGGRAARRTAGGRRPWPPRPRGHDHRHLGAELGGRIGQAQPMVAGRRARRRHGRGRPRSVAATAASPPRTLNEPVGWTVSTLTETDGSELRRGHHRGDGEVPAHRLPRRFQRERAWGSHVAHRAQSVRRRTWHAERVQTGTDRAGAATVHGPPPTCQAMAAGGAPTRPPRSCGPPSPRAAWPTPCSPPATRSWPSSTRWSHDTADVPWSDTVVFHMDEYVGVGPDHPAGFQRWIRERIVEPAHPKAALLRRRVGRRRGRVRALRRPVARSIPLDLCCLGIGENGHLAFNDPPGGRLRRPARRQGGRARPGLPAPSRSTRATSPTSTTVPAAGHHRDHPGLAAGRAQVLAIVPEARKAEPVRAALTGPIATSCPASALRTIPHATIHLEPESARLLPG